MPADTPVLAQWRRLKAEARDADWLFFRLGDFYELFFDDALAAAPVLGVQLTSRDRETPMCGVPFHALDEYLGRAVLAGFRVAIAEQLEDPAATRGLVARGIVRTVGPGTYVPEDGALAGPLAAVYRRRDAFGLAVVWVAEGRVVVFEHRGPDADRMLAREWERHRPAEVIANVPLGQDLPCRVQPERFAARDAARQLAERLGVESLARWGLGDQPLAATALLAAWQYAEAAEGRPLSHLLHIQLARPEGRMYVDRRTLKQLGIVVESTDGRDLWHLLNHCQTPMGERLLAALIRHPLADAERLERRWAAVAQWQTQEGTRRQVRGLLGQVGDVERRLARVAMELATPRDLVRLGAALDVAAALQPLVAEPDAAALWDDAAPAIDAAGADPPWVQVLPEVATWLWRLDPEAGSAWDQGGLIRPEMDADLDRARQGAHDQRAALIALEARLRTETGIRGLRIRSHKTLGYLAEVPAGQVERVPAEWRRRQSTANAERFTLPALEDLATAIALASSTWVAQEEALAREVLAVVRARVAPLQVWAHRLAELDVATTLAEAAVRYQWTRPTVGAELVVDGVRHPVVALHVDSYVASDLRLASPGKAAIITGPNMAGKSTFMRAIAQNAWLAQMGSFVAAQRWQAPIFDGIYPRIGAEDDLAHGRSTFLVEMEEVAQIVQQATGASLVILDELGRGTATFDGMAIAWAVLEHLVGSDPDRSPWALIATHYHELTQLESDRVINLAVDAVQRQGQLVWLHEVHPGRASESFGVAVAALAGVPRSILRRAERLLAQWEKTGRPAPPPPAEQMDWLGPDPVTEGWLRELDRLNLDQMTPLEALSVLTDWQRRRSGGPT